MRPLGTQWKGRDVFVGPLGLPALPDALYRNDGAGTFAEVTALSGLGRHDPGYGFAVLFIDSDDDGDLDLYVANDSTPNFLYRNDGLAPLPKWGYRPMPRWGKRAWRKLAWARLGAITTTTATGICWSPTLRTTTTRSIATPVLALLRT